MANIIKHWLLAHLYNLILTSYSARTVQYISPNLAGTIHAFYLTSWKFSTAPSVCITHKVEDRVGLAISTTAIKSSGDLVGAWRNWPGWFIYQFNYLTINSCFKKQKNDLLVITRFSIIRPFNCTFFYCKKKA